MEEKRDNLYDVEGRELELGWCIWECYKLEDKKEDKKQEDFKQDLATIYTVRDVAQAVDMFALSHYSQPSNLFSQQGHQVKKFKVDGQWKSIESLMFFREGIRPEWEDDQVDGSFKINLQKNSFLAIDSLWNAMCCYLMAYPAQPSASLISGVKLISRRKNQFVQNRLEIWLNGLYSDKDLPMKEALINLLNAIIEGAGLKVESIKILEYEHFQYEK